MRDDLAAGSLRERKKALTRASIVTNAQRLFEERGYDNVTVAEIAAASHISVKTLFVYFRSKEQLAFAETTLIDSLVRALLDRPSAITPACAIGEVLKNALTTGPSAGVEGFHHGFANSEALKSPLLRMWSDYEDKIAEALAQREDLSAPTAEIRLLAIQLIGIVRSFTSGEVRELARRAGARHRRQALLDWLRRAIGQVDGGHDPTLDIQTRTRSN